MKKIIALFLVGLMVALIGCTQQDKSPVAPDASKAVLSSMPPEVQTLIDRYAPPEDASLPLAVSRPWDTPAATVFDTSFDVYAVTFLWGRLCNASAAAVVPPTDWSGSLSVNGVAIINVTSVISFESGQDSVLEDSIPATVSWVSITDRDFDGLSSLVFLKRGIVYIVPPVLTFATPPITLQYDFGNLIKLDAFYRVDSVNSVAVHAQKLRRPYCPRGLISGQWVKDDSSDAHGHITGLWLDRHGVPVGVMSGSFWTTNDMRRLFSGTVSAIVTNLVLATFEGSWFYDDPRMCPLCGAGHGQFSGHFTNIYLDQISGGSGIMKGEFGDYSLPPDDRVLPLHGFWLFNCANLGEDEYSPEAAAQ